MRIGIVTGEYPPMEGGIGAYTRILANEISQKGADVSIFSSQHATSQDAHIPVINRVISWNMGSLRAISRWANSHQIDVIDVQYQTSAFQMSPWIHFLPQFTHIPVVTTFHDLRHPYLFPKAGGLRNWVVMHLAKSSAGIIVTNTEDYRHVNDLSQKVLIPIGSNIRQALPAGFDAPQWRAKANATKDDYLVAYFGLINQTKGLETLMESVAALRSAGIPVRLVMVGGGLGSSDPTNAAYLNRLKTDISRLEIEPFIHWTGYLKDDAEVGAYLTASDTVALPFTDGASYRRGSLMAAIEYGCAIVSTTPRAPTPVFRNGDNMLLVSPNNTDELTAALGELQQSEPLRQHLKKGASELRQEFDWSQIATETMRFFEQVLYD